MGQNFEWKVKPLILVQKEKQTIWYMWNTDLNKKSEGVGEDTSREHTHTEDRHDINTEMSLKAKIIMWDWSVRPIFIKVQ